MADANYTPHQYLRWGGKYGPEGWSVGVRMQVSGKEPGESDEGVSRGIADAAKEPLRTWFTTLRPLINTNIDLSWITCNHVGRNGKYTSSNTVRVDLGAESVTGSGTTNWCGPDMAVAVSLLTGAERGYASKGRLFLPINNLQLDTNPARFGELTTTNRQTIATATATLLSELNDLSNINFTIDASVCIFSPGTGKNQSPLTPGEYRPVINVRVGAQPDTQRRRLNKQPDLWKSDSVTVGVNS